MGPHPYQLNAGNRCANRRFPRSRATVGAQGMRSISTMVCVHLSWPLTSGTHTPSYPPLAASPLSGLRRPIC
jgi:hypothetical protein